jgi:hypothetical protein
MSMLSAQCRAARALLDIPSKLAQFATQLMVVAHNKDVRSMLGSRRARAARRCAGKTDMGQSPSYTALHRS